MATWKIVNKNDTSNLIRIESDVWWAKPKYRMKSQGQVQLQRIYEDKHHILCNCSNARMFVRKNQQGVYVLVNHPVEGRHISQCTFYSEISGEISNSGFDGDHDFKQILTFCMHDEIKESEGIISTTSNTDTDTDTDNDKNKKSHNKIYRLLSQLCNDSLSNVWFRTKTNNSIAQLAKIRDAAETINFGQSCLKDYLFFGDKGEMYANSKLRNTKDAWKGAGRPHVFLLEIIEQIDTNRYELNMDGNIHFYSRIVRPCRQNTKGPYLVISSLVLDDDNEVYRNTACIKPIVSNNRLMLVDSNYERETAISIMSTLDKMPNDKTISWSLTKPLKPKQSDDGEMLLPDFIVQKNDKVKKITLLRDLVEVMGTDETEYVLRKDRLTPKMVKAFNAKRFIELQAYKPNYIDQYLDELMRI
mgnify:CR=1 FL=1